MKPSNAIPFDLEKAKKGKDNEDLYMLLSTRTVWGYVYIYKDERDRLLVDTDLFDTEDEAIKDSKFSRPKGLSSLHQTFSFELIKEE